MEDGAYSLDSAAYGSDAAATLPQEPVLSGAALVDAVYDPYCHDTIEFESSAYASYPDVDASGAAAMVSTRSGDPYASEEDDTVDSGSSIDDMNPYQLGKDESKHQNLSMEPESSPKIEKTSTLSSPSAKAATATPTNFNLQFQQIMELEDSETKYEKISRLANDFAYVAESYGKIIIAEKSLPVEQKTIKPINVGGLAHALCSDFLCFAAGDSSINIYGNEENAQKIASHELLGLNSFFLSGVPGLFYPLMALVQYLGFCVVAISVIPIDKDTLKYGSADGGKTMHYENPHLYEKVRQACRSMNLKPHKAGLNPKQDDPDQYGPGDIEGHEGTDGRFYMLDFARLMPPECPLPGQLREKGSLFFQLLRPELVKSNAVPLSSDALTGWGMKDPNKGIHNREVLDATLRLRDVVIPRLAEELAKELDAAAASERSRGYAFTLYTEYLCPRLHGAVRKASTDASLRNLILVEMIARVMKCALHSKLRRAVSTSAGVEFEKCRQIVASILNLLLHTGSDQVKIKRWWCIKLKSLVEIKFPGGLSEPEQSEDYDLLNALNEEEFATRALFSRFIVITRTQLARNIPEQIDRAIREGELSKAIVIPSDIVHILPRTKKAVVGDLYLAFSKYLQALRVLERDPTVALRLLELVLLTLKRAPQMNSTFYEKMLRNSLSRAISSASAVGDAIAQALSQILDTSMTLNLTQQPGMTQETFSKVLAEEYANAARVMRKSGALNSAQWMLSRAIKLKLSSVDISLESTKCDLNGKDDLQGLVEQYPNSHKVSWAWLMDRLRQMLLLPHADFDEQVPQLRESYVHRVLCLCNQSPHVFARKRLQNYAETVSLGLLLGLLRSDVWDLATDTSAAQKIFQNAMMKVVSKARKLTFPNVTITPEVADIIHKACHEAEARWSAETLSFSHTKLGQGALHDITAASARHLTRLVLRGVESIDSLEFLKNLSQLRRLTFVRCVLKEPRQVGKLPEYFHSDQLESLHLHAVPGLEPEHIAACLRHFSSLLSFGAPFYNIADYRAMQTAEHFEERLQSVQTALLSVYSQEFHHIRCLRIREITMTSQSFSSDVATMLNAAPRLEVLDLLDAINFSCYKDVVSLAHPSLLSMVMPSGEVLWFSGSKSRVCQARSAFGQATSYHLTLDDASSADYRSIFSQYDDEAGDSAPWPNFTPPAETSGRQNLVSVGTVVTRSSVSGSHVQPWRPFTPRFAQPRIESEKSFSLIRVGSRVSALFELKPNAMAMSVAIGNSLVHVTKSQMMMGTFNLPGGVKVTYPPGGRMNSQFSVTVGPQTCISAQAFAVAFIVDFENS